MRSLAELRTAKWRSRLSSRSSTSWTPARSGQTRPNGKRQTRASGRSRSIRPSPTLSSGRRTAPTISPASSARISISGKCRRRFGYLSTPSRAISVLSSRTSITPTPSAGATSRPRPTSPRQRSSYASRETRLSMFCNNISSLKSASHTSRRRTPTRPHIENGPTAASSQSARETASIIPTSRPGFAKCGTSTKSTA